jgi:hypothetical protein
MSLFTQVMHMQLTDQQQQQKSSTLVHTLVSLAAQASTIWGHGPYTRLSLKVVILLPGMI